MCIGEVNCRWKNKNKKEGKDHILPLVRFTLYQQKKEKTIYFLRSDLACMSNTLLSGRPITNKGFFTTVPSVEAGSSVLPIDSHVPQFYPFGEHGI